MFLSSFGPLAGNEAWLALHRMFSYADGFEVTAVQLGTLVSAMANGGKLLVPQIPNPEDTVKSSRWYVASWTSTVMSGSG